MPGIIFIFVAGIAVLIVFAIVSEGLSVRTLPRTFEHLDQSRQRSALIADIGIYSGMSLGANFRLRGDAAAMNAACERWVQADPPADELAYFNLEWARSRALLESDLSAARRLWEDAARQAAEAGVELPPAPPWAEE